MTDLPPPGHSPPGLVPTPEQRRTAALHFEQAGRLVASGGHERGISLLRACCRLDPANLLYRQALRRAGKSRWGNNLRGSRLTWLWAWPVRARLRAARSAGRYLDVLNLAERVLALNPWDVPAQRDQADAALALGLTDLAVWTLEQARHKDPEDADLNRRLARLHHRRGNFRQAQVLWDLVRKAAPADEEAGRRLAELDTALTPAPAKPLPPADPNTPTEEESLRGKIPADPANPNAYRELAAYLRAGGRHEEAHAILLEGLAAAPQAYALSIDLADLQIDPFRHDLAATQRRRLAEDTDELRLIEQRLAREVYTRELDLFRSLMSRFPQQAAYRYETAVRLLRLGQVDEAVVLLESLKDEASLTADVRIALAWCSRATCRLRPAMTYFEEALSALPGEAGGRRIEVLYELARCHAELGEMSRAVDLAGQVVALDRTHRDMADLLADWQSRGLQAS